MHDALIFIDTNILLDFYRLDHGISASLVKLLDRNSDRLIINPQLEFEFKKHRQKIITETLSHLKTPDWSGVTVPQSVASAELTKRARAARKEMEETITEIREEVMELLRAPEKDEIYKTVESLFRKEGPYCLHEKSLDFPEVIRSATDRFQRGYPPRKPNDSSMGDAIHWAWILKCADLSKKSIIIISRDGDFGVTYDGETFTNDWLQQEFDAKSKQQLHLVQKLTDGLSLAGMKVTPKEKDAEDKMLKAPSYLLSGASAIYAGLKLSELPYLSIPGASYNLSLKDFAVPEIKLSYQEGLSQLKDDKELEK